MNTLLNLGFKSVSLEHIVMTDFTPARKGGEEYFNEETEQIEITTAQGAKLDLTLTSVHLDWQEKTFSQIDVVGGSASDHLVLFGRDAEELAIWLQSHSVIIALEVKPDAIDG